MKNAMLGIICGFLAMVQTVSANYVQQSPLSTFSDYQEEEVYAESGVDRFQLDFYGSAGAAATFQDSLEAQWPYSVFGGQAWVNGRESLNVFSVKAEGQLAYGEQSEAVLSEAFAQHDWRSVNGLGASLLVGQRRNLAKEWAARSYEAALPRPMDAELPFTENLSGGAFSVYWDKQDFPVGVSVAGAFGVRRTMPHQSSDTLMSAFPEPQGKWTGAYHISGYADKLALHLSWEKQVGHNVSLYTYLNPRLSFCGSWTYSFHPNSQLAPDNLYALKGNWDIWVADKHSLFLAGGLDFGEQSEALQAFVGYGYSLPMNGWIEVQLGVDTRYRKEGKNGEFVGALCYRWRPE